MRTTVGRILPRYFSTVPLNFISVQQYQTSTRWHSACAFHKQHGNLQEPALLGPPTTKRNRLRSTCNCALRQPSSAGTSKDLEGLRGAMSRLRICPGQIPRARQMSAAFGILQLSAAGLLVVQNGARGATLTPPARTSSGLSLNLVSGFGCQKVMSCLVSGLFVSKCEGETASAHEGKIDAAAYITC